MFMVLFHIITKFIKTPKINEFFPELTIIEGTDHTVGLVQMNQLSDQSPPPPHN